MLPKNLMGGGKFMIEVEVVKDACFRAAEILSGMGYIGKYGCIHLLKLLLQKNTVTAILHNLIGWQISQLDQRWEFKPSGGGTPDLVFRDNAKIGVQIKCSSDKTIKGNRVSTNEGFFILVKYTIEDFTVSIKEIRMGELSRTDWTKGDKTQYAFLNKEAEERLCRIYP